MASSAMTHASETPGTASGPRQVSILLYSDDITTRDAVRAAVGRRPTRDLEVESWLECATLPAVIEAVENGRFDLLILDGEAAPAGGLGVCRQLKNEIFGCPPVLVLTGRPQDVWLAAWSLADAAVSAPFDALAVCAGVEQALAAAS
jgi:DNA-binding response OmpR family regulator